MLVARVAAVSAVSCLAVSAVLGLAVAPLRAQVPTAPAAALRTGPGVIRGRVVDAAGQPVTAASVTVRGARDSALVTGALTSADGRFRLAGLFPGGYLVRVSRLGYAPLEPAPVTVTPAAAEVDLGDLRLEQAPVAIEGIEVTGEKSAVVVAVDRTIYSTKSMPVAGTGTAVDVLRSVPELEVDVDAKVTMRGNQSVAIHINGRPAPMRGEALQAFLKQFPASMIDRVEVIPNPSARYDPEGMGGIVDIELKRNVDLGLSGTLTANAGTSGQSGLNSRLAYQRGPVTLFGGGTLMFYRMSQSSHDLRENLLTQPISYLDLALGQSVHATQAMLDGTLEYKLNRLTTAWATATAAPTGYNMDGDYAYLWLDSLQSPTSRTGRLTDTDTHYGTTSFSAGIRRQVTAQRDEWSAELRRYVRGNDNDGRWTEQPLTLAGEVADLPSLTLNSTSGDQSEWVAQVDVIRPLGKAPKLEAGVQGRLRSDGSDNLTRLFPPGMETGPISSSATGYLMKENLASAYATLSAPVKKLTLQLGLRAEHAQTSFEVHRTGDRYDNTYNTIFPSANLLFDLGGGRRLRLSYSRRLDRPSASYLNPDVPSADPLNRSVGNPFLLPSYTNSVSLDLSWTASNMTWRIAPYLRRTTNGWDNVRTVDTAGVSTITYANIASLTSGGASFTASLRQTGRVGGYASMSVYGTHYDAVGLGSAYAAGRHVYGSATANASLKLNGSLDAQGTLIYMPPRDLPQGRISHILYNYIGLRQRFGTVGWANISLLDPFRLYRYGITTRDGTHVQNSNSSYSLRAVSIGLTYRFGKPPQSNRVQRTQEDTAPQPSTDRSLR